MTKTEAIIQLRLGPGINEDVSEKYNDAVDMAIEALQTPPISQRSMYQAGYRQGREEALKDRPKYEMPDCKKCEYKREIDWARDMLDICMEGEDE